MPKLIHKDKVTRLKNYNYTPLHDNVEKVVSRTISGDLNINSTKDIMEEAGYLSTSQNAKRGVVEIVREKWPTEDRVTKLKDIADKSEEAKQYGNTIKAIEVVNKMVGDYAPVQTEVSGNIHHEHEIKLGNSNYLEFYQQRLDQKQIVEGEIVDE